jgi:hypothetical protein
MKILLLLLAFSGLAWCAWLLRQFQWPSVQVRVLSSSEEITGYDDGLVYGILHAELEYWFEDQCYQVKW